ncbi:M1-specific T cell receptor alpha chain isoform X3 [Carassius gibelio]|uniref:M1-specific T cell receptor alpha chain isoform X3 n=1 Tax=Carassius gibelio TaxID=101364 RepID=UPI00227904A0|nr:M1-specific T cell receptor alpha chain isoform X3 [Carassius gibelio]XP_052405025.1 M1-specific T cell receptor alpha chain isoform X3 [Carassius gibelio]
MSENATLWSSGSGFKIIMGSGTKLIVQTQKKQAPVFYKLHDSYCLATDFTKYKDVNLTDATPVRYSNRDYYSSFSFNDSNGCDEKDCKSGSSDPSGFESDEKTNYMSLGLYWLRILFLKTVVFNVLMTFKAWMS